jgi:uncharacterized protein YbcC (UPF0753/DUF2309 family)
MARWSLSSELKRFSGGICGHCAMLNRAGVGDQLSKQGVNIPETTSFLAVEHNTTTNEIPIMKGNASDLMTGLPLQSVYRTAKRSLPRTSMIADSVPCSSPDA